MACIFHISSAHNYIHSTTISEGNYYSEEIEILALELKILH